MSKQRLAEIVHELDALGIIAQIEDDAHLTEALEELGLDGDDN